MSESQNRVELSGDEKSTNYALNDYEHFKIRRDMIVHEDTQINHRVNVLLTTQSILFAAVAVALTSSYRITSENHVKVFVSLLGISGMLFGSIMIKAIWAARCEQGLVKGKTNKRSKENTNKYRNGLHCATHLEDCLQASSSRTFFWGFSYSIALPVGSLMLWAVLLVLLWKRFV